MWKIHKKKTGAFLVFFIIFEKKNFMKPKQTDLLLTGLISVAVAGVHFDYLPLMPAIALLLATSIYFIVARSVRFLTFQTPAARLQAGAYLVFALVTLGMARSLPKPEKHWKVILHILLIGYMIFYYFRYRFNDGSEEALSAYRHTFLIFFLLLLSLGFVFA